MKSIFFVLVFLIALSPDFAKANLKEPDNKADYIIIGPASFLDSAKSFILWRTQKGLTVKFCSLEDVYKEFDGINSKQEAIRVFVNYAYDNWQAPKLKYLLLAGGINLIPSYKIKSELTDIGEDSLSSDRLFAVSGNDFESKPSVIVGRIPARNEMELSDFLNKTMKFEDAFNFSDYKNELLTVIEVRQMDGNVFDEIAEIVKKSFFQNSKTLSIRTDKDTLDPQIRIDLIQALNKGTLFMLNLMHANAFRWGFSGIAGDSGIENTILNGPPLIFTSISSNQHVYSVDKKTLLEQFLMKSKSGAIASFTPASLTYLSKVESMINLFFDNLINKRMRTLGEAVQSIPENNLYIYCGDPALKNPYSNLAGISGNEILTDIINIYPNPASENIEIKTRNLSDELAEIGIFDLLGTQIADFSKINLNAEAVRFNISDLQNGVYFIKIQTQNKTIIKHFIKSN